MLRRAGLRLVPVVGWALTAYELYQLAQEFYDWWAMPASGLAGYTAVGYCNNPAYTSFRQYSQLTYLCGLTQGAPMPDVDWNNPPNTVYEWWDTNQWNSYWKDHEHGYKVEYQKIPGAPYYGPALPLYSPVPFELPWLPWIDPLIPPLFPMPRPNPLPVRRPGFSPRPNPEASYPPKGYAEPGAKRSPRDRPVLRARPRRKGEKERKVTASNGIRKWLGWALSQYSEVGDLVDALYDALPDALQDNGANLWDKIETLYEHVNDIDMVEAMSNIVYDQVTDPKFATQFERMQEALAEFGIALPDLYGISGSSGPWHGSLR